MPQVDLNICLHLNSYYKTEEVWLRLFISGTPVDRDGYGLKPKVGNIVF